MLPRRNSPMRPGLRLLLVSLAVLSAGCVGGSNDDSQSDDESGEGSGGTREGAGGACSDADCVGVAMSQSATEPPSLPVGRAWTYASEQTYTSRNEVTIVVAEVDANGYLLAGAAPEDLVYHALWGSQWMGRFDRSLARADSATPLFDFPLSDGKSWTHGRFTVTAHAAQVATPQGPQDGFHISGDVDDRHVEWTYAPEIGFVVSYLYQIGGQDFDRLTLTAMASRDTYTWFEMGDLVVVSDVAGPQHFDPAGYDAVIASAGGVKGRAFLSPPPAGGDAWQAEFGEQEDWRETVRPASPGTWGAAIERSPYSDAAETPEPLADALGWAYMHVATVNWVDGVITPAA